LATPDHRSTYRTAGTLRLYHAAKVLTRCQCIDALSQGDLKVRFSPHVRAKQEVRRLLNYPGMTGMPQILQ